MSGIEPIVTGLSATLRIKRQNEVAKVVRDHYIEDVDVRPVTYKESPKGYLSGAVWVTATCTCNKVFGPDVKDAILHSHSLHVALSLEEAGL